MQAHVELFAFCRQFGSRTRDTAPCHSSSAAPPNHNLPRRVASKNQQAIFQSLGMQRGTSDCASSNPNANSEKAKIRINVAIAFLVTCASVFVDDLCDVFALDGEHAALANVVLIQVLGIVQLIILFRAKRRNSSKSEPKRKRSDSVAMSNQQAIYTPSTAASKSI